MSGIPVPMLPRTTIGWQPWRRAAFEAARADGRLVLLFLTAPWSPACVELEDVEFARPELASLVTSRFVPVRVDACAFPDVSDRYVADGWPTVACLTADGEPLCAASPTRAEEIHDVLSRALDAIATRGDEIRARADAAQSARRVRTTVGSSSAELDPDAADWVVARALDAWDREHGGFGCGAKFAHSAVVRLLVGRHDVDQACRAAAVSTLDALAQGLADPADGGFFRAARQRNWSDPDTAKALDVNADLIELFVDAGEALGRDAYLRTAERAIRFVRDRFALEDGGFGPSAAPSSAHGPRTMYVDINARMARTCIRAAQVLGDRALLEFAIATLERLMVASYRPGSGVAHVADGRWSRGGLLADQVHAAFALAESAAATGMVPHLMLAEELMGTVDRTMRDVDRALVDRVPSPDDVGLMTEPIKPFALNCDAARVWLRLAMLAERPEYRERATVTLASQSALVRGRGLFGADYAVALEELQQ
jgi:uncharacterized protein